VTPIQLARAIGGIAVGGVWHTPHLVRQETGVEKPHELTLSADNVRRVVSGMYGVVNEGGTGAGAKIPGIDVCGKTGTAQVASADFAKTHKDAKENSWFVAFAPCYKPEIVVSVLWEGGAWGKFSAPVARDVLKSYFDKKARSADVELQKQNAAAPALSLLIPPRPIAAAGLLESSGATVPGNGAEPR